MEMVSATSGSRKKFNSTASAVHIEEDWSSSPYTQEYQKLDGELKHDTTGERRGAIGV